jgi:hypothetical protein
MIPAVMRKMGIAVALLFGIQSSMAQVDTSKNVEGNAGVDSARKHLESGAFTKTTGDNKQTFWGTLGILGSYVGETGNTVAFEPTLYNIASLINKDLKKEDNYKKEKIIQNFQLNLGVNPAQSGGFTLDSMQFGATYAIKNNKKLTSNDYKELASNPGFDALNHINTVLVTAAANDYSKYANEIMVLLKDTLITIADLSGIPSDLIKRALDDANVSYSAGDDLNLLKSLFVKSFNTPEHYFKAKTDELSKRSLVTASFNSIVNLLNGRWQEYDFTPVNWYVYLFKKAYAKKGKLVNAPGLNISGTYVLAADTSNIKSNLNRQLAKSSVGINFIAWADHNTQQPYIEIKPAATFQYIWQGKYTKETTFMVKPSVTLRFDFTKNLSFPITLGYDKSKPNNLFGFLSIQYTPGK